MRSRLYFDFELRSRVDLKKVGLDLYAKDKSTEVTLMSYAFDDEPVQLWQTQQGPIPAEVQVAWADPLITKIAWNAEFERTICDEVLGMRIPYEQWHDPMVYCRHLSMPGSLESVCKIIGLKDGEAKLETALAEGGSLLKTFCQPYTRKKKSPLYGQFLGPTEEPELWERFCQYARQDTIAMRLIYQSVVAKFPFPEYEQRGWCLDQKINDIGIPVDTELVGHALAIANQEKANLIAKLIEITALENPISGPQFLPWIQAEGYPFGSLGKTWVNKALEGFDLSPRGGEALRLRQQATRTSIKKLEAIQARQCEGRVRHQFSFLGAARTGRWSGKGVQPQNLPRPSKEVETKFERCRELLKLDQYELLKAEFPNVMDAVASSIRSVIAAPAGKKLVVCDLNAIENRVLGWVAHCDGILEVFREGLDPYKSFAVQMVKKKYEEVTKAERQSAKPAVLGAGYRLGGGEQKTNKNGDVIYTGLWGYALGMGVQMTRDAAHRAVKIFRDTYPEVVQVWYQLEETAIAVIRDGEARRCARCSFERQGKILKLVLPSGRALHYVNVAIEHRTVIGRNGEEYDKAMVLYDGSGVVGRVAGEVDEDSEEASIKGWGRLATHGGRLVENIVQAISRDLLLHGMFKADDMGFEIVGTTHDEIVSLVDKDSRLGIDDLRDCMIAQPEWALDLPLGADGFEADYYKKD